jgi:hypothetical protein
MDSVIINHREVSIQKMLREIEAEIQRLQKLIEESEAYIAACDRRRRQE